MRARGGLAPHGAARVQLTLFGYLLLPVCAAAILQPGWQLQLVLLASAFGAASPLVLGGLGLPPGVIPACLFLAYVALQFLLGARFPAAGRAWRTLEPLLLAALYALVTAVLVPRLMAGSFTVWPQKPTPPYDLPVPIQPSLSNITQGFYLLLDTAVLAGVALHLGRSRLDPLRVLHAYLACGYLVVAICAWQLASKLTELWYPEAVLYSNPGWAILPGQMVGTVPRINGPFSEPAALAFYLSGIVFCCAWLVLRGHRSRAALGLLPLAILALVLSTSTTGFVALGVGGGWLVAYGLSRAPRAVARRIFLVAVPVAAAGVAAGLFASTMSDRIEDAVAVVTRQSLAKADSDSFATRTGLDLDSLAVLWPTYGFGAGWGSVRASSLGPGLLANLGVFGAALLAWFAVRVARQVGRARRLAADAGQLKVLDGLSAAVAGHLVAAFISAPALNAPDFYVLLGTLIACAARAEEEGRRMAAARLARRPAA